MAAFCYRQFFPSPFNDEGCIIFPPCISFRTELDSSVFLNILLNSGWGPYAYFKAMEETRSNTHAASPVNALSLQVMGAQNVNERRGLNGDPIAAFSADRYTSIRLDEIESGEK